MHLPAVYLRCTRPRGRMRDSCLFFVCFQVRVWDLKQRQTVQTFSDHTDQVLPT
jgi:hypothetical protein